MNVYFKFWISGGDWNGPMKFEIMRLDCIHMPGVVLKSVKINEEGARSI